MQTARRKLTYADLLRADVPDAPMPELIDGELYYKASPRAHHALVHSRISGALASADEVRPGGWWILIDVDVIFSDHRVLRPDLSGWRRERLPELPDGGISVAPDWVCEILSPGHVAYDRATKCAIYAEEGVGWLWLVSPEERTVEVFQLRDGAWTLLLTCQTGERVLPPFEHVVDVETFFRPRRADDPPLAKEPELRYRAG